MLSDVFSQVPWLGAALWQITFWLAAGLLGSMLWSRRPARAHRLLVLAVAGALLTPLLGRAVRALNCGLFPPDADKTVATAAIDVPAMTAPPHVRTAHSVSATSFPPYRFMRLSLVSFPVWLCQCSVYVRHRAGVSSISWNSSVRP